MIGVDWTQGFIAARAYYLIYPKILIRNHQIEKCDCGGMSHWNESLDIDCVIFIVSIWVVGCRFGGRVGIYQGLISHRYSPSSSLLLPP